MSYTCPKWLIDLIQVYHIKKKRKKLYIILWLTLTRLDYLTCHTVSGFSDPILYLVVSYLEHEPVIIYKHVKNLYAGIRGVYIYIYTSIRISILVY